MTNPDDWELDLSHEDPYWQAHVDQLQASMRESNRKAIKSCITGRWIYGTVFVLDFLVFIAAWINGKFAWYAVLSMILVALMAWGNEVMLRSARRRTR